MKARALELSAQPSGRWTVQKVSSKWFCLSGPPLFLYLGIGGFFCIWSVLGISWDLWVGYFLSLNKAPYRTSWVFISFPSEWSVSTQRKLLNNKQWWHNQEAPTPGCLASTLSQHHISTTNIWSSQVGVPALTDVSTESPDTPCSVMQSRTQQCSPSQGRLTYSFKSPCSCSDLKTECVN